MFYSGQHGQLYIKSAGSGNLAQVGNLKNWSINFAMSVLDTTTMGDTDRTLLHGVRSFSGQSSLLYYQENNSNVRLMTKDLIYGKSSSGSSYSNKGFGKNDEPELSNIVLRLWDGNTRDLNVVAFVTGFTMSCAVGEVVTAEFTFEGHGAPTDMDMIT